MAREIKLLTTEPPPGVCAWPINDRYDDIKAQIQVQKQSFDAIISPTTGTTIGGAGNVLLVE